MVSIKIDGAFPEYGTKLLAAHLNNGWEVYDRILFGDRYVTYLLRKENEDPDLGKCFPPAEAALSDIEGKV